MFKLFLNVKLVCFPKTVAIHVSFLGAAGPQRAHWTSEAIEDLIDIILEDETVKARLLIRPTNRPTGQLYEEIVRKLKERYALGL